MTQGLKADVDRVESIDIALLRQIADDRNTIAMQTLYDSYRSRLVPFLRRMTQDQSLIEEAYNDVMLTLWNKASQFKGNSKVSSWIFSIAYRVCLRFIKKQQFRQKVLDSFLFFKDEQEESEDTGESNEVIALNRAIAALPAKQRIVIELSYFQEYSIQQIAEIADCPVNTVKTRLHHGRQKIRAFMDDAKKDET